MFNPAVTGVLFCYMIPWGGEGGGGEGGFCIALSYLRNQLHDRTKSNANGQKLALYSV